MRKVNHILACLILILVFVHAFMAVLIVLGLSTVNFYQLPKILLYLVAAHGVLGLISTIPALRSGIRSGKWYMAQNKEFWIKRASGLAIALLLTVHASAYITSVNGAFFLREFTAVRWLSQLLFLLSIFIHIGVSVKSTLIAQGTLKLKDRTFDGMLVLSVLAFILAAGVTAYYIQWQF